MASFIGNSKTGLTIGETAKILRGILYGITMADKNADAIQVNMNGSTGVILVERLKDGEVVNTRKFATED